MRGTRLDLFCRKSLSLDTLLNGVEAFLYCQIEGAVSDETVTLARQQSTDLFYFSRVNVVPL